VQTGDNVLIGGFIIGGTVPKQVLIRAIGPSLANFGLSDSLQDPTVSLFHGSTQIAANDDWQSASNFGQIPASLQPTDPRESAILITLQPDAYTAIVAGKDATTCVGLVEVYDLNPSDSSQLINISTRGVVQTGDNVMIAGVIVQSGTENVLVRALGPTLASFRISNPLANPTLELHDANGVVIAANDNWKSTQPGLIIATGKAPPDDLESAIVRALGPGNYTAIVRGVNNTTGVALVEVYALQ